MPARFLEQSRVAGRWPEGKALSGLVRLELHSPLIAAAARPGQFVMVRPGRDEAAGLDPLLRRPLSIHYRRGERLGLLFKIVGRGTARLAKVEPGQTLDLLGPLGRPFPLEAGARLLVGGGLGQAPLLFLAEELGPGSATRLRLGAASAPDLAALEDFKALGLPLEVFTEDGSLGRTGLVTLGLAEELAGRPAAVCACGPEAMLREVARLAAQTGRGCHLSLEARMACGLGACLGCSIEGAGGARKRVCLEGPVFEAGELGWT